MSYFVLEPVHDWTVTIGDWWFGIVEHDPVYLPRTYIYYGPGTIETNLSACAVLGIAIGSVVALFTVLWFLSTKLTPSKPAPT
jgi:hypothetical protein